MSLSTRNTFAKRVHIRHYKTLTNCFLVMFKNISNTTLHKCWTIILTLILMPSQIASRLHVYCMRSFMASTLFKASLRISTLFIKFRRGSLGSLLGRYSSRIRRGRRLKSCWKWLMMRWKRIPLNLKWSTHHQPHNQTNPQKTYTAFLTTSAQYSTSTQNKHKGRT